MSLFFTRPDCYLHVGTFPLPRIEKINIGGAPEFMKPLRALFISDVHLRPGVSQEKLRTLLDLISSQEADVVFLGGDYAESTDDCLRFFDAFKGVHAPLGVYAVSGNNDVDSMPTLEATMARAGVTLLRNHCIQIDYNGGYVQIAGCEDHKYGNPRTRDVFPESKGAYRILISHWPVQPDCTCDLMLSGHTHAGQFNLLGVTPYSIGFEWKRRLLGVRGLKNLKGMRLLIGNGIGVSRIPMRIGAEPQIYLLNFVTEEFI